MSKHNVSGHNHLNIDPFRFMELDKPDILYKLTIELGYSEEEALREFQCMTAMLTLLKSMRHCQSQTDDYLKDAVPHLHPGVKMVTVTILLNAMKDDDTYCHAYNTFVYYANRYMCMNRPRKNITDHKLLILLENEKTTAALPVTGKQLRTFSTSLNPEEQNTIRLRLIKDGQISRISEADFKYLFSAQPVHPEMVRICWKESRGLCHEFLSRVVYNRSRFKYRQANSCISFKDGRKLDSNDKSRAQYKNNDILDQILQF